MGVHRLMGFLNQKRNSAFCYDVSIPALATQFTLRTGRKPIIVVDGTNFLYTCAYRLDQHDWMMGGQLAECMGNIQAFVGAFQKEGIELVFYFDGSTSEQKRKVWVERKTQKLKEVVEIFNQLKGNEKRTSLKQQQPSLIGAFGQFMIKYTRGCRLKVAVDECDVEMAAFARREGCFAILADDTDFVILDAAAHFFSSRHLDLARMTTLCYDGKQLAAAFSLNFDQLPLLATLMGNDFLPASDISHFHKTLTRNSKDITRRISMISELIRGKPSGDRLYSQLPEIARELLGNEKYAVPMKESLQFYLATAKHAPLISKETKSFHSRIENWNNILRKAKTNHVDGHFPQEIFNILVGGVYQLAVSLEDKGGHALPGAALAYKNLRDRIYSVLLSEKPGDRAVVAEWCAYPDRPIRKLDVIVGPSPAGAYHPGLLVLWGTDTPEIHNWKWELFVRSVSPLLSPYKIQNLPERHIVPVVVLFYLTQECNHVFKEWEIDAFLSMVVVLGTMPRSQSQHNAYPPARAVECANLFSRGISYVIVLMTVCGLQLAEAMPWHYFDGKLFLAKYLQAGSGTSGWELCHKKDATYKAFKKMRSIVYNQS